MFNIGQTVLDSNTNEKLLIISKNNEGYLVSNERYYLERKSRNEVENYNFIKYFLRKVKRLWIK